MESQEKAPWFFSPFKGLGVKRALSQSFLTFGLFALLGIQIWSVAADQSASLVINEIAYRGTSASTADEWIELYNTSSDSIDLTGWQFLINSTPIALSGTVAPYGFFLLERSDDLTISDISADKIFSTSLSDSGSVLQIKNPTGQIVDQVSQWYVDLANPPPGFSPRSSMERISPLVGGDVPQNWRINDQETMNGQSASGGLIFGTPARQNSHTLRTFGYGYAGLFSLSPPISPQIDQVVINELQILPPAGEIEWVELLNTTGDWLDLSLCHLHDSTSNIFQFGPSSSLLPHEYFIVEFSSAKLSDTGDRAELRCQIDAQETIIDGLGYGTQSPSPSYISTEGYDESLGYLPTPNGFNTLGRSPDGNSLWFLLSHDDYPSKSSANPDLRPVPGVSNPSFVLQNNQLRLSWDNPSEPFIISTRIYASHSGTENQFALQATVPIAASSVLLSNIPNEIIDLRLVTLTDTGHEATGLDIAHLQVNNLGIEISEVLPYPKTGLEFVELHNRSAAPIDLSDFELAISNDAADLNDPSGTFEFASLTLAPGEYFAFFIDPAIHSFRLSNVGSLITLSDPNGIPVAELDYLAPARGVSVAFDGDLQSTLLHPTPNAPNIFSNSAPQAVLTVQGSGSTKGCTVLDFNPTSANSFDADGDDLSYQWTYRVTQGATLFTSNEENPTSFKFTEVMGEFFTATLTVTDPFGLSSTVSIPLELQYCGGRKISSSSIASPPSTFNYQPSTILINELFPNPQGADTGQEFVELLNTGTEIIPLDGWKLGGKTKKKLDGLNIGPKQFLTIEKITLKNSSDTIELIAPDKSLIASITYPDPYEARSYGRDDRGSYRWGNPTPGMVNDFSFKPIATDEKKFDLAEVVSVVDGDTIKILLLEAGVVGGTKSGGIPSPLGEGQGEAKGAKSQSLITVRLLGVDTPETVHPFKPLQFFGKEASAFTRSQLSGKTIRLEYDQKKYDKYGRHLAYVYLGDQLFNATLVEQGYAFAYLRFPFRYFEDFRLLEEKAKAAKAGMWKSKDIEKMTEAQMLFQEEEGPLIEVREEVTEEELEKEEVVSEELDQTGWQYIQLNEVLPNPVGKDDAPSAEGEDRHPRQGEYIELINLGESPVALVGWKILNNKNKKLYSFGEDIDLRLQEYGILLLDHLQTTLKNTTETIQLIDPLGTVRDELSYDQSMKDDQVWSRGPLTGSWQLLPTGTPGAANEIRFITADQDSDRDGISDEDEIKLGLNPRSWDSDGNTFPDDFELLMNYHQVASDGWGKSYVDYLGSALEIQMKQTARTLTFSGRSRPYTTLQLTIHSTPQTVFPLVAPDGAWSYRVDLGLEKGEHRAEAIAIDPLGVQALASPIPFVLQTRMNVSKLTKVKKIKTAKKSSPKIKPLYVVADARIKTSSAFPTASASTNHFSRASTSREPLWVFIFLGIVLVTCFAVGRKHFEKS